MVNNSDTTTLPRALVEQALEALGQNEWGTAYHDFQVTTALRAALEQPQDHVADAGNMVPTGWKLVPVEPTDDMLYDIQEFSHILPPRGKRIWAHMLAAAPQPPTTEQSSAVQPQGEHEPVAWYDGRKFYGSQAAASMNMANMATLVPLYTHSQNLNCKSNQARLATLWGYVKPQPKREPLCEDEGCPHHGTAHVCIN